MLRDLRVEDLPRILELEAELFAPDDWSAGMYRDELTAPGRRYFALEAEEIVGWGGVYCDRTAEILTLGVTKALQRRGYATRILAALLEAAETAGAREVFLEVRADDPGAQALYQKFGFEPLGIRQRYYPVSGKDAVVMRKIFPRS